MTSYEAIEGHIKALRDVPKKWHIPSSFRLILTIFNYLLIFILLKTNFDKYFLVWNLLVISLIEI